MLQLYNNPPNETANDHATIQLGVNGGSHNRVGSISAVAESAGNRKLALTFCTDEAGSRTEKLRITGDGDVNVNTGNLKIGAAGKGILFHPHDETATANGSDSNLLDDYEEGHFQPSISSSSRTGTINYSNRVGFYTKIGNRVFAQIYLRLDGGTNTTNTFLVTGLPFTCISTTSHEGGGYHTYMANFFTATADRHNTPWVTLGTSSVRFYKTSDGGSIKGNETSTSSTYLIFHVQYVVA
jgi:hypothetical protein